jgi:short-subunit dehydrogenase
MTRNKTLSLPNYFCTQSVSPGAVATEFAEASDYQRDLLEHMKEIPFLQSKDIADAVIYVLGTPPHVQVGKLYTMYNQPAHATSGVSIIKTAQLTAFKKTPADKS